MSTVTIIDHLGDEWTLLLPMCFKLNRNGLMIMWAMVCKGPAALTTPPYAYQEIPLPVFTEWWEPVPDKDRF